MSAIGDIKDAIISFINEALQTSFSGEDCDNAIQTCLNDLAEKDFLKYTDDAQTLSDGSTTLNYPTDHKDLIAITLTGSGQARQPLIPLPGGHDQYRELKHKDANAGAVEYFSEFDDKFWLWRPAGQSYTVKIEGYRYHPQGTLTNILFSMDFINAIKFGSTFYKALLMNRPEDLANWSTMYAQAKESRRNAQPEQPYITRG